MIFMTTGCTLSRDETAVLTDTERYQITDLVLSVAQDPAEMLKPVREEVWSILHEHQPISGELRDLLEIRFITIGEGHRLFWLDARDAVRRHEPVKSPGRARWEDRMVKDGWLSPVQRDQFGDLMALVATEEPIPSNHGVEISLNPEMVDEIANSWDEQEFRRAVSELLAPPG